MVSLREMLFPGALRVISRVVGGGDAMAPPDEALVVEVPLPPDGLFGKTFDELLAFHRDRGIKHLRSVEHHRVRYHFADPADADAFRDRFGCGRGTRAA